MNKIEIFKPFGEAWDWMNKILFQPFDLRRWLVIGFAAWLSHIASGGYSFNYRSNEHRADIANSPAMQGFSNMIHQIPTWIIVSGVSALVLIVLALLVLFIWLRARGRFVFADCVVRNRAAIVEPWREFRREGNSFFGLSLLVAIGLTLFLGILALPFLLPFIRRTAFLHLHDVYLISVLVGWFVIMMLVVVGWGIVSHFAVIIMYRRRCRALAGVRAAFSLIFAYPGEITLYCLFWVVLGLATACLGCIGTCATCCLAALPYVGSVILLPIYVFLRAFSLRYLRQFGPEYDAWEGIVPPTQVPLIPPAPPTASPDPPPLPA